MTRGRRPQQREASFTPGDPTRGYYNDLGPHLAAYAADAADGRAALWRLAGDRHTANPVTIAQLGLGAWQRADEDERWLDCVDAVSTWLANALEPSGAILFRFPLRGTYNVSLPWVSAMAQGEAASLFVRASAALGRPELLDAAVQAVRPLIDGHEGVVVTTPEGAVLEEYPTMPPSHVLNGWIFALWGLYDVAQAPTESRAAAALFEASTDTLAARLRLYELPGGWTRYDLFPHRIPNIASPFYHALHVAQLRALGRLVTDRRIDASVARWEEAARSRRVESLAIAGKVAFRLVRPRRRPSLSLRRR